jgi:hypothetical protein
MTLLLRFARLFAHGNLPQGALELLDFRTSSGPEDSKPPKLTAKCTRSRPNLTSSTVSLITVWTSAEAVDRFKAIQAQGTIVGSSEETSRKLNRGGCVAWETTRIQSFRLEPALRVSRRHKEQSTRQTLLDYFSSGNSHSRCVAKQNWHSSVKILYQNDKACTVLGTWVLLTLLSERTYSATAA